MPIYRIGPQANRYEGIDTQFYERQLNAKQAKADANRAAWSSMLQSNANVAYLDEEARANQIAKQNAMWEDIMKKNQGNLALATNDIMGAIETSKQSPYWNLNSRHTSEMAARDKALAEYGAEAIDLSKNLDGTPIYDKETGKYMNPMDIKANVIKASNYSTNVEKQLADLSPQIREYVSQLGIAQGTPEYYAAAKQYTEKLSAEDLYAISMDPAVQQGFLANNPTALIDNRNYAGTDQTYKDVFSSKEGLGRFIYGNIMDKNIDIEKNGVDYKENWRYREAVRNANATSRQDRKQQAEFAEAERIRNLSEAYTPMSTTVDSGPINDATVTNAQKNIDALTGNTEGSIPNLEKNINNLENEIATKFKIPGNKAITVAMIDQMLANDEVLSDSGRRDLMGYRETLNNLYNTKITLNNEYNNSMSIVQSVNNTAFDKLKESSTKDEWARMLNLANGDEEKLKKLVMNTPETGFWENIGDAVSFKFKSPEEQNLMAGTAYMVKEFNKIKNDLVNSGKVTNQKSTFFDFTDKNSAGYKLDQEYKIRAEKGGKQDVALYTNARGENALNTVVNYNGDPMTVEQILNKTGKDGKVDKKLYKHETHFGINGQRHMMLVPTEFGKVKGLEPIQVGQFTYDKDNRTVNNSDLNHYWKMYQQSRGINYSPGDKAQNMAWISGNIASKLPGGQEILADATKMLDVARQGLGDNKQVFRVGDIDYFVNGYDIYAKASDGMGGVQNIPVSYDEAMFIPLERKTKEYYNSSEFKTNKWAIENTGYKTQNKLVGNRYSNFGAGSDPIK